MQYNTIQYNTIHALVWCDIITTPPTTHVFVVFEHAWSLGRCIVVLGVCFLITVSTNVRLNTSRPVHLNNEALVVPCHVVSGSSYGMCSHPN